MTDTVTNRPVPPPKPPREPISQGVKVAAAVVAFLTFVIAWLVWECSDHPAEARVTRVHWVRQRVVEARTLRDTEDWENNIDDSKVVTRGTCYRRYRRSERCHPHSCGRGGKNTCYSSCSVYGNWCAYSYYEWNVVTRRETNGATDDAGWPDVHAVGEGQRQIDTEEYTVNFSEVGGERTWSTAYPHARWSAFHVGQRYRVRWTHWGDFEVASQPLP